MKQLHCRSKSVSRHITTFAEELKILLPGIGLASIVAIAALISSSLQTQKVISPLLIAIIIGIIIRNTVSVSKAFEPGISFSAKKILRLAVVLLGLKLSFSQILSIGIDGISIIVFGSIGTFLFTCWLGAKLGVDYRLTQLIAVGTSICGASAVAATTPIIGTSEEDVAYAIATITGLGTLAIIGYPILQEFIQLSPIEFGVWSGASIHEVAQVVAASFQQGAVSGEIATVIKLSRVLLIIPVIVLISFQKMTSGKEFSFGVILGSIPWFVCAFIFLSLLNSVGLFSDNLKFLILNLNQFFLCLSMAGMGLITQLRKLASVGMRPLCLAVISWVFLGTTTLFLIKVTSI